MRTSTIWSPDEDIHYLVEIILDGAPVNERFSKRLNHFLEMRGADIRRW